MARERSKNQEEKQGLETRRGGQISRAGAWPMLGPFSLMRRFAEEMDRMWEGFGQPTTAGRSGLWGGESFSPDLDIFERDRKLVIKADLPGLNKDEVTIDVTEDEVVIEGQRKYEHEESKEGVYRSERSYGHFTRRVPLPEGVDTGTANATFKNGVLEITFEAPKTSSKETRRVQIQGETEPKSGQTAA